MEAVLALLVGVFFAVAVYLMMSQYTVRILLGVAVLGNGVYFVVLRTLASIALALEERDRD